jgi:hypothetical protein
MPYAGSSRIWSAGPATSSLAELRSQATALNGRRFDIRSCWLMRFIDEKIVNVRAYLDSARVQKLFIENET